MKACYTISGTTLVAEHKDLVCFDQSGKFLFADINCKNKSKLREIVLNSNDLHSFNFCLFKGKRYTIDQIYTF